MKKRVFLITVLCIFAIVVSFIFDSQIVKGVSFLRNLVLDDFFIGITFLSSEIIIFFILTSLFLWKEHKRRWVLPLWMSLGLSAIVSFLLKILIQRQRPFQLDLVSTIPALEKASYLIWNFSFPSFQAMLAFCSIPILAKEFPKFKYIWIAFAVLIAFSRVYFGVHFLSDVIFGGLIGFLIGIVVVKIETKIGFGEKVYKRIFKR